MKLNSIIRNENGIVLISIEIMYENKTYTNVCRFSYDDFIRHFELSPRNVSIVIGSCNEHGSISIKRVDETTIHVTVEYMVNTEHCWVFIMKC